MTSRDWIDIAVSSIPILKDQKIDIQEAKQLIRMAEKDGLVDENEKRVLNNIFSQVDISDMDHEVQNKIKDFRGKHGF